MLRQAQASVKGILNFISTNIQFGFDVSNEEAIRYFESKGLKQTFNYFDMQQEEHNKAVTVAKMLDMDMLQDVHDSLTHALKKGWTYAQWSDRIIPILQSNGWWGRQEIKDPVTGKIVIAQLGSPHRLKTIFRTNMQQAYMVGRWQQIMQTAKERPYLRYDAIDDRRTRPKHKAWDGMILPFNHPFWRKHYPPNGFNCRCSVTQFSKTDLEAKGYDVTQNPELSTDGIDAGFEYNAGLSHWNHLQDIASQKAQNIQDQGLRKAAQETLDDLPKVVKLNKKVEIQNNQADKLPVDQKNNISGAAYFQQIKPRSNEEIYGQPIRRTVEEAKQILAKAFDKLDVGWDTLDDYKLSVLNESQYQSYKEFYGIGDFWATYGVFSLDKKVVHFKDIMPTGGTTLFIHESVMDSDEAIIQILYHEMYEIEELRYLISSGVNIQLYWDMVRPDRAENLHYHAVRESDNLLLKYRNLTNGEK